MNNKSTYTQTTTTKPYLIRALHEWCTDNGFTPFIAVQVNERVMVPQEHVNDGEIVLNLSYDATSDLLMGNESIEFKARFGGRVRELFIPVDQVVAIYARENGSGMAFTPAAPASSESAQLKPKNPVLGKASGSTANTESGSSEPKLPPPSSGGRPILKRIK